MKTAIFTLLFILAIKANGQDTSTSAQYNSDELELMELSFHQQPVQNLEWKNKILSSDFLLPKEYKDSFSRYDFSPLWTMIPNGAIYGFIDTNFQRLQIKLISIAKDRQNENTYIVSGKSFVKNNICRFKGSISVTNIRLFKHFHWGIDLMYKDSAIKHEGVLIAKYYFKGDNSQIHSGIFEGILVTFWYVDSKGQLRYDMISPSDGYCNDLFNGYWKGYNNSSKLICNWGDFRAPFSGDLDIGAGEFSPNEKYCQNGWQTLCIINSSNNASTVENYTKKEEQWWK